MRVFEADEKLRLMPAEDEFAVSLVKDDGTEREFAVGYADIVRDHERGKTYIRLKESENMV